ncbi:MAG: hypothetical protein WC373_15185 [Smithella sp.]
MDAINWKEEAEKRYKELINEAKEYISLGMSKDDAIDTVLCGTCIAQSYKNKLVGVIING